MSEAWQVVSGCDLPSCTQACSQQVLGACSQAVLYLLAVSSWLLLAQQPCIAGSGRMGAEQLAGLVCETAVLDCHSQIDQTEKYVASLCWVALSPDKCLAILAGCQVVMQINGWAGAIHLSGGLGVNDHVLDACTALYNADLQHAHKDASVLT